MKKIGIVSCYFKHNYGSMLQAYATQQILDNMHLENETINIDENVDFANGKKKYYATQITNVSFIKSKLGMIKLKFDKKLNKELGKNICIRDLKYKLYCLNNMDLLAKKENKKVLDILEDDIDNFIEESNEKIIEYFIIRIEDYVIKENVFNNEIIEILKEKCNDMRNDSIIKDNY